MNIFITGKIKELEVRLATTMHGLEDGEPERYRMYADSRTMAVILHSLCPIVKRAITKYNKLNPEHDLATREISDLILAGKFGSHEQADAMRIYQEILDATDLPDIAGVNDNWI